MYVSIVLYHRRINYTIISYKSNVSNDIIKLQPDLFEELTRVAALALRHLVRRARDDDLPAGRPALGTYIYNMVGDLDDVEVVFDDDDRIAAVDELVQHLQQQTDVLEMKPRRGFVQDVERAARVALRKLGRELVFSLEILID